MRKFYILSVVLCVSTSFFISCQQDIEIWDSATIDYSGRYVIKIINEKQEVIHHYDGKEVRIYNTSKNIENELWIDDVGKLLPLKSKFMLSGTPASFASSSQDFNQLTDNLHTIVAPPFDKSENKVPAPTKEGETISLDRPYLRATVIEGKIIPKVVKTKGGNTADSLYLKVKLFSGKATFKGVQKAKTEWKDPNVAEYEWVFENVSYDASKDETYVISGHSYTGFAEDQY